MAQHDLKDRDDPALRAEAMQFSRYLLGRPPEAAMVERYVEANRTLFGEDTPQEDRALLGFCQRHPSCIGLLDGAAGWLQPDALLRKKILVMGAILEASPRFAPEFLRARTSTSGFVLGSGWWASRAATKLLIGSMLLWWLRRNRG